MPCAGRRLLGALVTRAAARTQTRARRPCRSCVHCSTVAARHTNAVADGGVARSQSLNASALRRRASRVVLPHAVTLRRCAADGEPRTDPCAPYDASNARRQAAPTLHAPANASPAAVGACDDGVVHCQIAHNTSVAPAPAAA